MAEFFKTVLFGLLYIVLSPFIVLLLAIYFIYCLLVFIYMSIRNLIIFFTGGTVNGDLSEDIQAKRILQERLEAKNNPVNPQPTSQNLYNMSGSTIILAHPDMLNNLNQNNIVNKQPNQIDAIEPNLIKQNNNDSIKEDNVKKDDEL